MATAGEMAVTFGSTKDGRLSFKHDGTMSVPTGPGSSRKATITGWTKIVVLCGQKHYVRCFVIEPGDEPVNVGHAGFSVAGTARVSQHENNARRARDLFRTFALPGNSGN